MRWRPVGWLLSELAETCPTHHPFIPEVDGTPRPSRQYSAMQQMT
jgi:hypothetical protein